MCFVFQFLQNVHHHSVHHHHHHSHRRHCDLIVVLVIVIIDDDDDGDDQTRGFSTLDVATLHVAAFGFRNLGFCNMCAYIVADWSGFLRHAGNHLPFWPRHGGSCARKSRLAEGWQGGGRASQEEAQGIIIIGGRGRGQVGQGSAEV